MKQLKLTKCITTIGPSSFDVKVMEQLIKNGADCFRINMSHGTEEEVIKLVNDIKNLRRYLKVALPILLDTKGPEIRSHNFKTGEIEIHKNDQVTIYFQKEIIGYRVSSNEVHFSVDYADLNRSVQASDKILIDDGRLSLVISKINHEKAVCLALNSHFVKDRRGINLPDKKIFLPFLSAKDMEDVKLAVKLDLDYIAASFVQEGENIAELRKYISGINPTSQMKIISKIESNLGIKNFKEIIELSDGIMIARGDLGVDIPKYLLPTHQMNLIKSCLQRHKFVIVATQMLDSMIASNVPTRAEVTDVFWACLLGSSATMLSGETASGLYPVESIAMMTNILLEAEKHFDVAGMSYACAINYHDSTPLKKQLAQIMCSHDQNDVIVLCQSNSSTDKIYNLVNNLSLWHQKKYIFVISDSEKMLDQINLLFGVVGILVKKCLTYDKNNITNITNEIKRVSPSYQQTKGFYIYFENKMHQHKF